MKEATSYESITCLEPLDELELGPVTTVGAAWSLVVCGPAWTGRKATSVGRDEEISSLLARWALNFSRGAKKSR